MPIDPEQTYEPSYQTRVVEEKEELEAKLSLLQSFMATPTAATLPKAEVARLQRQVYYMTEYRNVLAERIAAF